MTKSTKSTTPARDFAGEMRNAGKSTAQNNATAVAILRDAYAVAKDEALVVKLRYAFIVGSVMGACGIGDNAAIDYLPLPDAKPGQSAKWKDYPVATPETFDPAKHRPLDVHYAYRGALSNWSNIRKAAGLPALKAPVKRAPPKRKDGDKNTDSGKPTMTFEAFIAPSAMDNAAFLAFAKAVDAAMHRALDGSAKTLKGEFGETARNMVRDLRDYVGDMARALVTDETPAPVAADETAAELARTRAELDASRAREAKARQELDAKDAAATARTSKRQASKAKVA